MSTHTTEGIVLQKTDYSESSLIIKLLTADEGVQSFIFQGAKRKNKKGNLISSMAVLSIEYYKRNDSHLAKITAIESAIVFKQIPFDPYRSSILFFMNEVLNQCIKEKEADRDLYTFVRSLVEILDYSENLNYFPIKFLYELTKYLGFYPQMDKNGKYFDIQEGKFVAYAPHHPFYLSEEKSNVLLTIAKTPFNESPNVKTNIAIRRELMNDLLKYYQVIFDHFEEIKSLAVLEATLS
ncbi:DNA repair protein RecO [Paracrocinitomix mangrovi]|uniref:DNA repair protein RecO n=1 Tax=Paracrocinitomix mangrovi TaxID=2862509 RepID=UPI001C8EE3FA|nr:DNA repair protein RecO [Paracrocinitomix mangrovi]UKN00145.1 DNA repair protein RecO [Paracrocinitomix mangrovi]